MAYPHKKIVRVFNLSDDPYEQNNLYKKTGYEQQQADLIYAMKSELEKANVPTEWMEDLK